MVYTTAGKGIEIDLLHLEHAGHCLDFKNGVEKGLGVYNGGFLENLLDGWMHYFFQGNIIGSGWFGLFSRLTLLLFFAYSNFSSHLIVIILMIMIPHS